MDAKFIVSAFGKNQYPPTDRPEIAFAGRSNVGKSSLLNTLLNRKGIARTSSRPGRTQSINFFSVGQSLYLVDLPGYGFARVPINVKKSWQAMVETYLRMRSNLRAVVLILDIRRNPNKGDIDLLNWLKYYGIHAIPVLTKADKISRQQGLKQSRLIAHKFAEFFSEVPVVFSAKTRGGREEIWEKVGKIIDS
ncbi:MAG TPA: YihA family ribosome biogenesis GTP-binding protein [Desulfobacteraceae bacterium]|nr:YihA family ribosome biogenesis GTP-binding protein [Desulfobacteraceae bacterium]